MHPALQRIVPPMTSTSHKGQSGRIGVFGGSSDYTGAPYFSAISALRVGADLSYVLTADSAAQVIKGYDPELMVTPVYQTEWQDDEEAARKGADSMSRQVVSYFSRLHCLVVGPGIGRHTMMLEAMKLVLTCAKDDQLPVHPELAKGNPHVTLTPNVVEFVRLWTAAGFDESDLPKTDSGSFAPSLDNVKQLASAFGGVTVVMKGASDHISDGKEAVTCDLKGGLKRCGGLGDILSGTLGTFLAWNSLEEKRSGEQAKDGGSQEQTASYQAYAKHGRSMGAQDVIAQLASVIEELAPAPRL
ncbi:Ribokinase-like protein [Tribonema minus]|uniref:ATP-dependent (S)-NAD(P)H-hydrate dehydratase n=1 Tax=Tribonema minus TaxID=303371 RepID=A0A835ZCS6_9STRA|nr:Ribokinase-like protein [Tribonema minus]